MIGRCFIMMDTSENMFWGDINDISRFTENTQANKVKKARRTSAILLAAIQLMENFIKGIKHMNAYDAASTIISDANWIQKSTIDNFYDNTNKRITIELGNIYYIDYGKTFCGELSYFHYGLCIGKRDGKILIVPMRSGHDVFDKAYHPTNNPMGNRKYRQALTQEGFAKNSVLLINDTKYISAGRIDKKSNMINNETLESIQLQVFQVEFPNLFMDFNNVKKNNEKLVKQICDQKELIIKLKNETNRCHQLLNNVKEK